VLHIEIGGGVLDRTDDGQAGGGALHHKGLLAHAAKHLRVDKAIREGLRKGGQFEVLGVRTVEQGHRQGVVEEHRIDAIPGVHRHALQVVHGAHVHEYIDQAAGDPAVLGQEQRELLVPAQGHGDPQIGNGDLPDWNALLHLVADAALHLVADGSVAVGQEGVGHIEHGHPLALVHEHWLGGMVEKQEEILLVGHFQWDVREDLLDRGAN